MEILDILYYVEMFLVIPVGFLLEAAAVCRIACLRAAPRPRLAFVPVGNFFLLARLGGDRPFFFFRKRAAAVWCYLAVMAVYISYMLAKALLSSSAFPAVQLPPYLLDYIGYLLFHPVMFCFFWKLYFDLGRELRPGRQSDFVWAALAAISIPHIPLNIVSRVIFCWRLRRQLGAACPAEDLQTAASSPK